MVGSFVRHGLTERERFKAKFSCKCSPLPFKNSISTHDMLSFAGSDTSAAAIRATFLYIITNSHVQSTLLEEIRNSSISNSITDAEARRLPYLQAVIKEGLRIYPPATGLMSKEVPAGGDTGFFVPGGTGIGWTTLGLMRNVKIWGEDADVFRPERWFEGTPEEIRKREIDM
jgi:cytochrome P450